MFCNVTIDVNKLGDYPLQVTVRLRYDYGESGFTWEAESLVHVQLSVEGNAVDITDKVKKNTLAAAELLNAASNEDPEVYEQLKAHVREKNPLAEFADALLRGHRFRVRTA